MNRPRPRISNEGPNGERKPPGGTDDDGGKVVKPLGEMTTEELSGALEALDDARPEDTALRLALYLELRRAATEEWPSEEGATAPVEAT